MSDSTKLMASPDEVEEPTAQDAPWTGERPEEGSHPAAEAHQPVVGGAAEPAPEVRGAFGTQEYTSVGDDPGREEVTAHAIERGHAAEVATAAEREAHEAAGEPAAAAEAGAAQPEPAEPQVAKPQVAEPGLAEPEVAEPTPAEPTAAGSATAEPAAAEAPAEGATEADAPVPAAEQVAGAVTAGGEGAAAAGDAGDDGEAAETGAAEPAASGLAALKRARDERKPVEGRVFGWNPGGFHVVIDGIAAFCPRSEMELEPIADPESYLDKTFQFRILKIQGKGRRIVLSRTSLLREEHDKTAADTLRQLEVGAVVKGRVASLTDFGAFVDVGGVEGLVHVSEISQRRVAKPSDALQVGQEVEVKVLKVERGGRRVSLSMKALEPDPWREVKEKYPEGAIVTGKVERTGPPGAFIELEPGLVGLLPTSEMGLPREAIPARAYPAGKEVKVQVVSVDPRRHRIGLAPEGSRVEGTRGDYAAFLKQQQRGEDAGFKPFAAALQKLKRKE